MRKEVDRLTHLYLNKGTVSPIRHVYSIFTHDSRLGVSYNALFMQMLVQEFDGQRITHVCRQSLRSKYRKSACPRRIPALGQALLL